MSSHYPKDPRPIVTAVNEDARRCVAEACKRQLSDKPLTACRTHQGAVSLESVLMIAFDESSWQHWGYALDLCAWEAGERNRRPSSLHINKFHTYRSSAGERRDLADRAFSILRHWLAVVDAYKNEGGQPVGSQVWKNAPSDAFLTLDAEAVKRLNASKLPTGTPVSAGGDINKRPPEERPELLPIFDDALALDFQDACVAQREKRIVDGRTVEDCLYFPIADAIPHLTGEPYAYITYIVERIYWLTGFRTRRPQWGTKDDKQRMLGFDALALRLVQHWLALQQALAPDLDLQDPYDLCFGPKRRLLLTDVEQLSDRVGWEAQKEIRQVGKQIGARHRKSALAA